MQRYFTSKKNKNSFVLNEKDSHHLVNVMRKNINDKVEIVFNNEIYLCKINDINDYVKCTTEEKLNNYESNICYVTIAQSLVKEQKMDYILQKSCELGVSEIIPLNVSRSIVKIDKKEDKKINRWQSILSSASEQSKRLNIPIIRNTMDISDLTKLDYKYKILCSVNEKSINIKKVLSNIKISDTILVVIGPEGGFTDEEEKKLVDNGFISVTFGNRVLRTETASLFILSIINYILQR